HEVRQFRIVCCGGQIEIAHRWAAGTGCKAPPTGSLSSTNVVARLTLLCLSGGSASCRWSLLSLRGLAANPVENLRPKGAFVVRFENSRLSILALSSPTVAPVVARMLDSFRLDRSGVTDSNRTMAKPWP